MNVIVVPLVLRVIYLKYKFGACGFKCLRAIIEPVLRNSK